MKRSKIMNVRPAGPEHQVVTVDGGGDAYRRVPCPTCPWRRDAVGIFPAEAFRHSANTAYDLARHAFACHQSGADKPATCAGFLLRGSVHNLTVRFALIRGKIDLRRVSDGGHELFDTYRDMAEANGVDPDDPVLRPCRA